jgi:hypothetical protein
MTDAREAFDTLFEERLHKLNILDVLKRIVCELCVVTFRARRTSHQETEPPTPHSFTSVSVASALESVASPLVGSRQQSFLGTVRLPRANSEDQLACDLESGSDSGSGSGSDVPSQTTSDDGSNDSDCYEVIRLQELFLVV